MTTHSMTSSPAPAIEDKKLSPISTSEPCQVKPIISFYGWICQYLVHPTNLWWCHSARTMNFRIQRSCKKPSLSLDWQLVPIHFSMFTNKISAFSNWLWIKLLQVHPLSKDLWLDLGLNGSQDSWLHLNGAKRH